VLAHREEDESVEGEVTAGRKLGAWPFLAIAIIVLNVLLAFSRSHLASASTAEALGEAIGRILGPLVIPILVVGLFAALPRFRNWVSAWKILFWASSIVLLSQVSTWATASSAPLAR